MALPLLVRSGWRLKAFYLVVLVSAVVAHIVFAYAFVSVWCLFAALLSGWLCLVFRRLAPQRSPVGSPSSSA